MWNKYGMEIQTIYGIKLERILELIRLFDEIGWDLSNDQEFEEMKRDCFNKVKEEL